MKRFLCMTLVLALVTVLLTGACAREAAPKESYKVGVLFPMTGAVAELGMAFVNGIRLMAEEINAAGGIDGHMLELVEADSQAKTDVGVAAITRLIERDGVVAVLGDIMSMVNLGAMEVTQRLKVPQIMTSTLDKFDEAQNPYLFRCSWTDSLYYEALVEFTVSEIKAKGLKVGALHSTDPWGVSGIEAFRKALSGKGIDIAAVISHDISATSVVPQLLRLREAGIGLLFVSSNAGDSARTAVNLKEIGWQPMVLGGQGWGTATTYVASGGAMDGTYKADSYDATNADGKAFCDRYRQKYGTLILEGQAVQGADMARLLARGLELAKGDPSKLKDSLESIKNFPAFQGPPGTTHTWHPHPRGSSLGKEMLVIVRYAGGPCNVEVVKRFVK